MLADLNLKKQYACYCAILILGSLLQGCSIFSYSRENGFLLKRMIKQPYIVGAVAPSSGTLSKLMVREALQAVIGPEDFVVEVGPGTGCVTRILLAQGIPPERLICVEIDPELHKYMNEQFPEVQTLLGDAADLENILAEKCGKIAAIVSSVPLKILPYDKERAIIQAYHAVLKPGGKITQFTYGIHPTATVPGLKRSFGGIVLFNVPPAFVWTFTKDVAPMNISPKK